MGLFTKGSEKALRRSAASFASNYIGGDVDIVAMAVTAPRGLLALVELFAAYQTAAADVGQQRALETAVEGARAAVARAGAGDSGSAVSEVAAAVALLRGETSAASERTFSSRDAQALVERLLRTFIHMAESDPSLPDQFRQQMSDDGRKEVERDLESFYGELSHQVVRRRSGDPRAQHTIDDMSTARQMFRDKYDEVVAGKGHQVAERATVGYARTMVLINAAIYGVSDVEGPAQEVEELVRSLLSDVSPGS